MLPTCCSRGLGQYLRSFRVSRTFTNSVIVASSLSEADSVRTPSNPYIASQESPTSHVTSSRIATQVVHVRLPRVAEDYDHTKRGNTHRLLISQFYPSSSMSVAGPSRIPPSGRSAPREQIGNTYEQDLLRLLDQLSLEERDEFQTSLMQRISAGGRLTDHEVALNDLIQQARDLAAFNQDRLLAERVATQEDSDVKGVDQSPTVQTSAMVPQPKAKRLVDFPYPSITDQGTYIKRNKRKKKKRQQHGEVDPSLVQTLDVLSTPDNDK